VTGGWDMMLANALTWIGRVLGILHLPLFIGIILITPPSEWAIFIIAGSILLIAIYGVFLFVAWRREFIGGILYLVFITMIALLIIINPGMNLGWKFIRLLIPSFLIAMLFLASGLLKQKRVSPV
jgi:hypothetical protein